MVVNHSSSHRQKASMPKVKSGKSAKSSTSVASARSEYSSRSTASGTCCGACGLLCKVCPEERTTCQKCQSIHYCSPQCLQWHWNSGGHEDECDREPPQIHSSMSIASGTCCGACGLVCGVCPEERTVCQKCQFIHYCSPQCLQWHWDSGGHEDECNRKPKRENSLRSLASSGNCCGACGLLCSVCPEERTVCQKCQGVHYCTQQCLEWHWASGGHQEECTSSDLPNPPELPLIQEDQVAPEVNSTPETKTNLTMPQNEIPERVEPDVGDEPPCLAAEEHVVAKTNSPRSQAKTKISKSKVSKTKVPKTKVPRSPRRFPRLIGGSKSMHRRIDSGLTAGSSLNSEALTRAAMNDDWTYNNIDLAQDQDPQSPRPDQQEIAVTRNGDVGGMPDLPGIVEDSAASEGNSTPETKSNQSIVPQNEITERIEPELGDKPEPVVFKTNSPIRSPRRFPRLTGGSKTSMHHRRDSGLTKGSSYNSSAFTRATEKDDWAYSKLDLAHDPQSPQHEIGVTRNVSGEGMPELPGINASEGNSAPETNLNLPIPQKEIDKRKPDLGDKPPCPWPVVAKTNMNSPRRFPRLIGGSKTYIHRRLDSGLTEAFTRDIPELPDIDEDLATSEVSSSPEAASNLSNKTNVLGRIEPEPGDTPPRPAHPADAETVVPEPRPRLVGGFKAYTRPRLFSDLTMASSFVSELFSRATTSDSSSSSGLGLAHDSTPGVLKSSHPDQHQRGSTKIRAAGIVRELQGIDEDQPSSEGNSGEAMSNLPKPKKEALETIEPDLGATSVWQEQPVDAETVVPVRRPRLVGGFKTSTHVRQVSDVTNGTGFLSNVFSSATSSDDQGCNDASLHPIPTYLVQKEKVAKDPPAGDKQGKQRQTKNKPRRKESGGLQASSETVSKSNSRHRNREGAPSPPPGSRAKARVAKNSSPVARDNGESDAYYATDGEDFDVEEQILDEFKKDDSGHRNIAMISSATPGARAQARVGKHSSPVAVRRGNGESDAYYATEGEDFDIEEQFLDEFRKDNARLRKIEMVSSAPAGARAQARTSPPRARAQARTSPPRARTQARASPPPAGARTQARASRPPATRAQARVAKNSYAPYREDFDAEEQFLDEHTNLDPGEEPPVLQVALVPARSDISVLSASKSHVPRKSKDKVPKAIVLKALHTQIEALNTCEKQEELQDEEEYRRRLCTWSLVMALVVCILLGVGIVWLAMFWATGEKWGENIINATKTTINATMETIT